MLLKAARSSFVLALSGRPDGQTSARAEIVARAAHRLQVPLLVLEGNLEKAVSMANAEAAPRFAATAAGRQALAAALRELGRDQLVLAGDTAALDELARGPLAALPLQGFYLVADAAWPAPEPRPDLEIVTSEMVVFEWLERAGTPAFRDLLPLIK